MAMADMIGIVSDAALRLNVASLKFHFGERGALLAVHVLSFSIADFLDHLWLSLVNRR